METNIALARSRSRTMMHLQLNQHRRNLKTAVVVNDFQMRISAMATSTQPHTVYLVTKFWKNIWIWDPTFDLMELCILLQQRVSHGKITLLLASSLVRIYVFYLSARYGVPVKETMSFVQEQYNGLSLDPEPTLDFNRVHSILWWTQATHSAAF